MRNAIVTSWPFNFEPTFRQREDDDRVLRREHERAIEINKMSSRWEFRGELTEGTRRVPIVTEISEKCHANKMSQTPATLQARDSSPIGGGGGGGGGEKSNSIYVTSILMACKRYTLFVTVTIIVEKFN